MVLETERLALRHLCAGDAAFILELVTDPDWLRFIGDRGVRTAEDARGYIERGPMKLYERLGQNSLQEKLTAQWVDRSLVKTGNRAPR